MASARLSGPPAIEPVMVPGFENAYKMDPVSSDNEPREEWETFEEPVSPLSPRSLELLDRHHSVTEDPLPHSPVRYHPSIKRPGRFPIKSNTPAQMPAQTAAVPTRAPFTGSAILQTPARRPVQIDARPHGERRSEVLRLSFATATDDSRPGTAYKPGQDYIEAIPEHFLQDHQPPGIAHKPGQDQIEAVPETFLQDHHPPGLAHWPGVDPIEAVPEQYLFDHTLPLEMLDHNPQLWSKPRGSQGESPQDLPAQRKRRSTTPPEMEHYGPRDQEVIAVQDTFHQDQWEPIEAPPLKPLPKEVPARKPVPPRAPNPAASVRKQRPRSQSYPHQMSPQQIEYLRRICSLCGCSQASKPLKPFGYCVTCVNQYYCSKNCWDRRVCHNRKTPPPTPAPATARGHRTQEAIPRTQGTHGGSQRKKYPAGTRPQEYRSQPQYKAGQRSQQQKSSARGTRPRDHQAYLPSSPHLISKAAARKQTTHSAVCWAAAFFVLLIILVTVGVVEGKK